MGCCDWNSVCREEQTVKTMGVVIPQRTGESLAVLVWLSKEMGGVAIALPVPKILLDGGCFCHFPFCESGSSPRAGTPPTSPIQSGLGSSLSHGGDHVLPLPEKLST